MIEADDKRTLWLHIRLSPNEVKRLETLQKKSISPKMSDYVRRVILNIPVTIRQRNQSMDDFMIEMIKLRKELNAIGNNYNQAVRRLHMNKSDSDIKVWLLLNEPLKKELINKVESIKIRINQFADQWLQ